MNKLFIILIVFLICLNSKAADDNKILKWAADAEGNAPYIFHSPANPQELNGFEVDFVNLLAKRLNRKPVFVQNQWDGLIPGLERFDYDIAVNGIEITDDRKEEINFSNPYYITYEQIVVRRSEISINSFEDLKGKKVGALKSSLAERILNEQKNIIVESYEGEVNAFEDLMNGRLDAALVDAPIALYYASWNTKLRLTGNPVGKISYGIAIKKRDTDLLNEINSALDSLKSSGELKHIYESWNLWNQMTAAEFDDYNPSSSKPDKYNEFIKFNKKEPTFLDKILRYNVFLPYLGKAALMTLYISIISMLLAIVFGLFVALTRLYAPFPFSKLAVIYIEVIRGTPLLIQLFFIYYGIPAIGIQFSPYIAAVLGLGLNYAAYEAENYRAGLLSVPRGQVEAAVSLGMNRMQSLRYIVLPQAIRVVIPPMTNDFISLLKDSSLVSVITMVELTKAYSQIAATYYDYLGTGIIVAIIYLLLGLPFVKLSRMAERKLTVDKRTVNF